MKEALNEVSAGELASLVARREVGARELVAHFQERIERLNPAINAVCTVNPNALAEGEACDRRLQSGERPRPLEGVPFVAKDNLDTKGLRTTFGSLLCANYVPEQDAIAVERLRAAGAVLIGADLCGADAPLRRMRWRRNVPALQPSYFDVLKRRRSLLPDALNLTTVFYLLPIALWRSVHFPSFYVKGK